MAGSKHVFCYYASWAHYRKGLAEYRVEDIPVELCTHIVYAFAVLDSKTLLAKQHDRWLDRDLENYEKFVQLKKKNPNVKLLLGLGGWNDSRSDKYSRMVADAKRRQKFVKEVVKLLLEYGFDGLDLDWEYPSYEGNLADKQGFTAWLVDLRSAFTPRGLLLTSAVSAGRRNIDRGYDIPKVAKLLDLIILMSYDFHGSWENRVAHHSPLYPEPGQDAELCVDFAVNYWIKKGAPAHKLVMGVPLYGRSWTLAGPENFPGAAAKDPGREGRYVKASGSLAFFECCLAHQNEGWTKVTGVGGPYITKGDQWVGYDDVDAVVKKAQYALSKDLGGVMVWDTATDDFGNNCGFGRNPLLTAIAKTLNGSAPTTTTECRHGGSATPPAGHAPTKPSRDGSQHGRRKFTTNSANDGTRINTINTATRNSNPVQKEGSGFEQTTKLPYRWLAWSAFSQSPEDHSPTQPPRDKESIDGSQQGRRKFTTTNSANDGTRINTINTATRNSNPVQKEGSGFEQTTKLPYRWLAWPAFSQSPEEEQNLNSVFTTVSSRFKLPSSTPSYQSNFNSQFLSSSSSSRFHSISTTTQPSVFSPRSFLSPSSSSSAASWFAECTDLGFAPDPASCSTFYRCTNNIAFKFTCPGGLMWHQDLSSCDWPSAVQCILPLTKPDLRLFLPPKTVQF